MNIKQKIYLFSGLGLVIVILLIGGVIKPLVKEIKITSVLVNERNGKLGALQKTDQIYLKKLEADYTNIKHDIYLIEEGFLSPDQIVGFFIDLENMAANTLNRLEIEAMEFPVFNLYLLGSFSNSMKFLGWLENSKYFVDVDSIKIRRFSERDLLKTEDEGVSVGDVKTSLEIKVYPEDINIYENQENPKSN